MTAAQSSRPDGLQGSIKPREEWLVGVAAEMKRWFDDLGFPLPPIQIRSGFPSSGQRGRNTAESWTPDDGESFVLFVRPDRFDAVAVAGAIAHQLCHIAVGSRDNHGHLFRHLAISIGLRGRKTESLPGAVFRELIAPIIDTLGPLANPELEPAPSLNASKQAARLVKVSCAECGYVARVSRKWLDGVGPPLCPNHGQMISDN